MTDTARQPTTLADWLHWQENLHPRSMDLDLDRVRIVAQRLGLLPFPSRVITVGGTNGKGSTVLLLEAILGKTHRVGTYTSPHLRRYTERIRIDGREVAESELCRACAAVEQARGDTPLTYFEFGTLAALDAFRAAAVDTVLLEVGMGGRLDATNVLDPDVAVITSIGLDHCDWLGHDRESIAGEKAGIFRADATAICADRDPPGKLLTAASKVGAPLFLIGRDFDVEQQGEQWCWRDWRGNRALLPRPPGVLAENLAGALAAVTGFGEPVGSEVSVSLAGFVAPGRRQVVPGDVELVLDVGHNAEAAAVLADWLAARPRCGATHAVLGMLDGKPVETVVNTLSPYVDAWYAGGLPQTDRGLGADALIARMPVEAYPYKDVAHALTVARAAATDGDRILVCGSFYTVGAAMNALDMGAAAA